MAVHCVTPNPAVDVTYRVGTVDLHGVNRVTQVIRRPGGKGVNVARLLAARGHNVAVYGFLGGSNGEQLSGLLSELEPAVDQRWTPAGETRLTIAVVDTEDTTMFNEPGTAVSDADWDALIGDLVSRCAPQDVVTVSGSLPAGSEARHLAQLVTGVKHRGARVIVDTSGPELLAAAGAGADVLKPNHHELADVTGSADIGSGIDALLTAGAGAVVCSMGSRGLVLGAPETRLNARLGRSLVGNPTGAGDALVAALAAGLASSCGSVVADLARALPSGVGWSAAAVLSPVAGEIDHSVADQLAAEATTEEM